MILTLSIMIANFFQRRLEEQVIYLKDEDDEISNNADKKKTIKLWEKIRKQGGQMQKFVICQ